MKVEENEVVLTEREQKVRDERDVLLYLGKAENLSVKEAAKIALASMEIKPTKKFVEWLSDGALTHTRGEIVDVEEALVTSP